MWAGGLGGKNQIVPMPAESTWKKKSILRWTYIWGEGGDGDFL